MRSYFKLFITASMVASCVSCGNPNYMGTAEATAQGNERGNGADYHYQGENNPWFIGKDRVIKYCIVKNTIFEMSDNKVEDAVLFAFKTWNNYWKDRDPENTMSFTSQIQKLSQCDGREDLKFYFGISDPQVKKYQNSSSQALGYSVRTANDLTTNWSKGFIWIAPSGSIKMESPNENVFYPDWEIGNNLKGVLIHELGHIYGIGHNEGTIMTKDLFHLIDINPKHLINAKALVKIDHTKELVLKTLDIHKEGQLGYYEVSEISNGVITYSQKLENIKKNFEMLFGRTPQGKVIAKVYGNDIANLVLEVSDSVTSRQFPIILRGNKTNDTSYVYTGDEITSYQKDNPYSGWFKAFTPTARSEVVYAHMMVRGNIELDLIIERNMTSCLDEGNAYSHYSICNAASPFVIRYFSKESMETLFKESTVIPIPYL